LILNFCQAKFVQLFNVKNIMKTNFSLLFYLKRPKTYQEGTLPIYVRITVDNKREQFTTGISCDPAQWNQRSGRMRGTRELARTFNQLLDSIQYKLY
jgi:Arm DNA-binding domain